MNLMWVSLVHDKKCVNVSLPWAILDRCCLRNGNDTRF